MDDLYRILIIDKDKSEITALERVFNRADLGFEVSQRATDIAEYISTSENDFPDVIITEIQFPYMNSLDFIAYLRQLHYDIPVVIVSQCTDFEYAQTAIDLGVLAYCTKPVENGRAEEVLIKIKAELDKQKLFNEYKQLSAENDPPLQNEGFSGLLTYIEKNYNKRLLLTELAPKFYINPNYCCVLFNKYEGMTFSQYLTKLRIEKAKYFLTKTTLPIKRIAIMVGFNDYFYFNKVFKKYEEITPSEYRKCIKTEES